jgi:hypothetical protein
VYATLPLFISSFQQKEKVNLIFRTLKNKLIKNKLKVKKLT